MNISIIAVGSELLLGQIANTNGQYLSKLFNSAGHNVVEHTVIGDNPQRLERVINKALENYDTVILTGGLGPTKDDLTKHTVAKVLDRDLVIDQNALDYIEQYFNEQNVEMTPNNRQQALVIEGAHVLDNKVGMAPGMLVQQHGKQIALLPGPPKEMKPMAKEALLPYFINGENTIFSELLRFAGIGESKVETELMDLIDQQTNPTIAPLAGSHEVNVRLTASGETKQVCEMTKTFAIYDGVTDGILFSRMKNFDNNQLLQGMLSHHTQFIDERDIITSQLSVSAQIVKDMFNTEIGISVIHQHDTVYLGILENDELAVQSFKMTQRRHLIKSRTQNYVLIRLLNWFK